MEKFTEKTFTVSDAIEKIGFGKFQYVLSVVVGFSWMADSMEIMLLAILTPALACEWHINAYQQALVTTCMFAGWTASSPFWGWFCDRFGRKTGLLIASILGAVAGIASAFAPSYVWFIVLRSIVGVAMGGVPQSATIFSEFLPTKRRAAGIIMLEVFWAIGASVEVAMAILIVPTFGWRGVVVASSLPLALFAFVALMWMPESARFHITHHRADRARKVLDRLAAFNGSVLPEGELIVDPKAPTQNRFVALLNRTHLVTTLLVWTIWLIQAFSYYGMSLTTTKLFSSTDECHGGNPANINSTLTGCNPLTTKDYVDMLITAVAEVPGLFVTFLIIDRLGRKWTMATQLAVFAAANLVLFFCMPRWAIVAIIFVARAMIAGSFQAAYVYTPEVYPTTLRALGVGAASMWGRVGAMLTPTVSQVLGDWNIIYAVLIYGATGLVGALVCLFLPIETKGRQLRETH